MHTFVHTIEIFEWGKHKARQNEAKHGSSFADSFGVFEDTNSLTIKRHMGGEDRYVTIGLDAFGRVLVVVYTWRGENIRIISAREAVRSEVNQYESEL